MKKQRIAKQHKDMLASLHEFLEYSREYRVKKAARKTSLKDDVTWLTLYRKSMKLIEEYDVDKINYGGTSK